MSLDKTAEIEDYLRSKGVFYNDTQGVKRNSHPDSYGTLVDFVLVNDIFNENIFSNEEWKHAVEYWTTNSNMQPPLRFVGFIIQKLLK